MIKPEDYRLLLGCTRNMKLMGGKPNIGSYYQGKEKKDCVLNTITALKWLWDSPVSSHGSRL